jgi:predicted 2-oxoglutarate/Fe(II)-dependent dioxygenase YbiX
MQLENYIHIESDAVPLDFCNEIVKEYYDYEYKRGTINDYERSRYRECDVIILSDKKIIEKNNKSRNRIDKKIYDIVNRNIEKYLQDYATLNFNLKEDTGYQLLKYKTGDYVTEHIDTSSGEHRTLSCSLALNDDYEGGELAFFDGELKYKLKKGDMMIFPSSFTYPHQVLPIISGTRYSIITWIK